MLWPIFQVRYFFRHGNSYHLNVTNHWHVPNMPTHIFSCLIPTIFPRLYVRKIIMNVGLDTSAQLINIEGKAKNMKYSK